MVVGLRVSSLMDPGMCPAAHVVHGLPPIIVMWADGMMAVNLWWLIGEMRAFLTLFGA